MTKTRTAASSQRRRWPQPRPRAAFPRPPHRRERPNPITALHAGGLLPGQINPQTPRNLTIAQTQAAPIANRRPWSGCLPVAHRRRWLSRSARLRPLGLLRGPRLTRARGAIRSLGTTTTGTGGSPAGRRGRTASRRLGANIRLTSTCGTGTAWFANSYGRSDLSGSCVTAFSRRSRFPGWVLFRR